MDPFIELLGESRAIEAARDTIRRLLSRPFSARRPPAILLEGETGSGKGLVASVLHRAGPRAGRPFVALNCAAIPETLLESELFGYERGAFTDARRAKPGLFQTAHQGTIFLDEVGLLPEALQAKLLTVIEERTVRRLGGTHPEPADAWVISATNTDLQAAIRDRRFREDLYHRLAVLTLRLPPLRERGRDVILLAEHLLARVCADYGLPPKTLSPEAQEQLLAHPWPGNVRELSNVLERVALLTDGPVVTAEVLELPAPLREEPAASPGPVVPPAASLDDALRGHLRAVLLQTGWNISRTASVLGITRNTVRARIEKLGLREDAPAPTRGRRAAGGPAPAPAAEARPTTVVSAPPTAIRWESRRVTLLRAVLEWSDKGSALDIVLDKLKSFGARIDEFGPTTVGAVFGLEPVEDAARRAAHAAMAMQNAAARGRDGEPFNVTTAIHVGQVLVGQVGGDLQIDAVAKRSEWTVLDPLLAAAHPGSIVASPAAVPFLARRFALERRDTASGPVHCLRGREGPGLGLEGEMAGFVGRRQELDLLNSRLDSARAGHGQIVGVVGEAGIGKSRLLYEFRQRLHREAVTYLEGHCLSYGTSIPYLPVLEILRAACRIRETDGPAAVTAKLRKSLEGLGLEAEGALPYLLRFLGLKEGSETLDTSRIDGIQVRTSQILRQMCIGASRQRPLIIALEDIHWLDASSETLAEMVKTLDGAPLLLIVTYRPGYWPRSLERSHLTQIALQPLSPEDSRSVLGGFLPRERLGDPVCERIVTKAEGNPLFLEELARTVREQGGPSDEITVPDTVEEVLRARINRLPERERRLLQSAAVIGKAIPVEVLSSLAEVREEELRLMVNRLRAADFLYEVGSEGQYSFKHALTHEVAYGGISPGERRELHARIVTVIERINPERLSDHVERLALHSTKGELWDKALDYVHRAGIKAAEHSAHRQAVAYFEQALEILARQPRSRVMAERAIDLRLDFRNSLHALGDLERILAHLREAETLATQLDDQRRLGQVFAFMTQYFRLTGDPDRAIESGEKALDIARWQPNSTLWIVATMLLGSAHGAMGNYRKAVEILTRTAASMPEQMIHHNWSVNGLLPVFTRAYLVYFLAELGEFEAGLPHAEEALREARAADKPYSLIFACGGAGTLYLLKGEIDRAIEVLEPGLSLCRTANLPIALPVLASSLGPAYALTGRSSDAIHLLEQAVDQARSMKRAGGHALLLLQLGDAYRRGGRITDASVIAQHALDLARTHKERGHEAYALRLLADIVAPGPGGPRGEAEALYRQALGLAEQLSMRPLAAHCHLGLGRLHARMGRPTLAAASLTTAVAAFRGLGMSFWLAEAEAELRAVG
jgi:transcriptional regulator with AAA-type ATPase domain/tetratricopeptide (TPR) repeat protein